MMELKMINVHVIPSGKFWKIVRTGAKKASFKLTNKGCAIHKAREMAMSRKVQLIIHRKDGMVVKIDDYSSKENQ